MKKTLLLLLTLALAPLAVSCVEAERADSGKALSLEEELRREMNIRKQLERSSGARPLDVRGLLAAAKKRWTIDGVPEPVIEKRLANLQVELERMSEVRERMRIQIENEARLGAKVRRWKEEYRLNREQALYDRGKEKEKLLSLREKRGAAAREEMDGRIKESSKREPHKLTLSEKSYRPGSKSYDSVEYFGSEYLKKRDYTPDFKKLEPYQFHVEVRLVETRADGKGPAAKKAEYVLHWPEDGKIKTSRTSDPAEITDLLKPFNEELTKKRIEHKTEVLVKLAGYVPVERYEDVIMAGLNAGVENILLAGGEFRKGDH